MPLQKDQTLSSLLLPKQPAQTHLAQIHRSNLHRLSSLTMKAKFEEYPGRDRLGWSRGHRSILCDDQIFSQVCSLWNLLQCVKKSREMEDQIFVNLVFFQINTPLSARLHDALTDSEAWQKGTRTVFYSGVWLRPSFSFTFSDSHAWDVRGYLVTKVIYLWLILTTGWRKNK